jgi:uncharacterized membrane protein
MCMRWITAFIGSAKHGIFFYTETALSWKKSNFVCRNMPHVFEILILPGLIYLIFLRRSHFTQFHLDPTSIVVISMVCIPAFTALVYMVNKYNLIPLHGVIKWTSLVLARRD